MFTLWGILAMNRNRLWVSDMSLWRDAITKSPSKAQVISDLGNAYYRLTPPDIDRAEQLYKWAVLADDTYFKAYHNLAIINFARGDQIQPEDPEKAKQYYQNAVNLFKQAVEIYPWNPDSWNDMGTAYLKLDDFKNADENYMRAIKIDPLYFKGFYNLGYSYGMQKRYPEAEEIIKKSLKIYDRDPKIWFALSNAQMGQKKYDDALESVRQAMTLMPENQDIKTVYDRLYKYVQDIKSGAVTPPP
jgi:Flp pilus assembly protein TadD